MLSTQSPSLLQRTDSPYHDTKLTTDGHETHGSSAERTRSAPLTKMATITPPTTTRHAMEESLWSHTPSWFSELNVSLSRMGMNSSTIVLVLAMVFVAVQIRQYNVIRDDPHRPSFLDVEQQQQLLAMKQHINFLEKELNDTKSTMHSKTDEIADKLEMSQTQIQQNTDGILKQQEMGENVQSELTAINHSVASISRDAPPPEEMADIMEFWRAKSSTNWISEIHRKPQSVHYGVSEYAVRTRSDDSDPAASGGVLNEGDGPKDDGQGIMGVIKGIPGAIRNGAGKWRQSVVRGGAASVDIQEEMWRDSANRNIADDASPHTLEPHDCLQFPVDTEHRWIELKLIERVVPEQFEYTHILKTRIPEKDWNLSPKQFRLFGKLEGGDWVEMAVREDTVMGVEDNKLVLDFKESQRGIEYLRVEWDIHAEAKSTRLYRLRIHGRPDV